MKKIINFGSFILLFILFLQCNKEESTEVLTLDPTSGDFGDEIVIEGMAFSSVPAENTVKFNDKQATIVSASSGQLVVKVPVGALTGKVSVSSNGVNGLSSTDFTVKSGEWVKTGAGITSPQQGSTFFYAGSKGYIYFPSFWSNNDEVPASFYEFNPATNSIATQTPHSLQNQMSCWGTSNGKGFCLGSEGVGFWQYDAEQGEWIELDNPYTSHIQGGLFPRQTFSIGNLGYVIMSDNSMWRFDSEHSHWEEAATAPTPYGHIAASNQDSVALFATNDLYHVYDAQQNHWYPLASFPNGLDPSKVCYVSASHKKFYIAFCESGSFWSFDHDLGDWKQKSSLPDGPMNYLTRFVVGEKIYLGRGIANSNHTSFQFAIYQYFPYTE